MAANAKFSITMDPALRDDLDRVVAIRTAEAVGTDEATPSRIGLISEAVALLLTQPENVARLSTFKKMRG